MRAQECVCLSVCLCGCGCVCVCVCGLCERLLGAVCTELMRICSSPCTDYCCLCGWNDAHSGPGGRASLVVTVRGARCRWCCSRGGAPVEERRIVDFRKSALNSRCEMHAVHLMEIGTAHPSGQSCVCGERWWCVFRGCAASFLLGMEEEKGRTCAENCSTDQSARASGPIPQKAAS